jgi:integrase
MDTIENFSETKKDYVNHANLAEPKKGVLFVDFIEKVIVKKERRMRKSYMRNYRTLILRLNDFADKYNAILYTESINEDFLDDFIVYMESLQAKKTYIKTLLSLIKAMARKAANYGYAVDPSYDEVDLDDEEIPSIYLSMNDIARIYYFNGLTRKQEAIRDLFVVGCLTALRYSDLITLQKENFSDSFITKITIKTGVKVIIPLHDFVKDIYKKYNGNLPKVTVQHFNRYIKLICKKIGLTESVNQTFTRGGRIVTETKEKWQLVSSHTARRSGATNLYNTGRIRIQDLMQCTGHKTEKSFMRYIKTTHEEMANNIAGDCFYRR